MKSYHWRFSPLLIALLLFALAFAPVPAEAAPYSDVQGHWAVADIYHGDDLGLVAGYDDATFRPENSVTRAELIAFMDRTFDFEADTQNPEESAYTDITPDLWYSEVVYKAEAAGLLDIYPEAQLGPNVAITRQEVAALLSNALGATPNTKRDHAPAYTDAEAIGDIYLEGVMDLNNRGLLAGYPDGSFQPEKEVSRAEAVVLLLRASGQEAIVADPNNVVVQEQGEHYILVDPTNDAILLRDQSLDGLFNVNGLTYALAEDNTLHIGWFEEEGLTRYATPENGLATGWQNIDGTTYYFQPYDFAMLRNGPRSTGEGAYYFDPDGALQTGGFPSGYTNKTIYWEGPSEAEMTNAWLSAPDAERRFLGQAIANYSAQFNGLPFKWYGSVFTDPSGVYCCGAAYAAYHAFGIAIPGPQDTDMFADGGYRMVKDQYLNAPAYGGTYIPTHWDNLWPGDLTYSARAVHQYNHVSIYLGKNAGRAMIAHATLADGFVIEPTNIVTDVWGYHYLDTIRYV